MMKRFRSIGVVNYGTLAEVIGWRARNAWSPLRNQWMSLAYGGVRSLGSAPAKITHNDLHKASRNKPSIPGASQWCAARASDAAPGAASGGLGPQRPRLTFLAEIKDKPHEKDESFRLGQLSNVVQPFMKGSNPRLRLDGLLVRGSGRLGTALGHNPSIILYDLVPSRQGWCDNSYFEGSNPRLRLAAVDVDDLITIGGSPGLGFATTGRTALQLPHPSDPSVGRLADAALASSGMTPIRPRTCTGVLLDHRPFYDDPPPSIGSGDFLAREQPAPFLSRPQATLHQW
ncbi:hypothetical protein THAOC_11995, partial [Thalassiosira oceanica]